MSYWSFSYKNSMSHDFNLLYPCCLTPLRQVRTCTSYPFHFTVSMTLCCYTKLINRPLGIQQHCFKCNIVHTSSCVSTLTLIVGMFWRNEIILNVSCGENANWTPYLLCQFVQHACAHGCCVCTEDVLLSFLDLPVILVPGTRHVKRTMKKHQNQNCILFCLCVYTSQVTVLICQKDIAHPCDPYPPSEWTVLTLSR